MSDKTSTDQYGRKTWDVEAYERQARSGDKAGGGLAAAAAAAQTVKNKPFLQHRAQLLHQSMDAVNKHTLLGSEVSATTVHGQNKRFGFSCPICDLSFRDTLALVDHLNSPQHARRVNALGGGAGSDEELLAGVKRASLQEVRQVIQDLIARLYKQKAGDEPAASLQERVQKRVAFEQKRLELRRQRRAQKAQASSAAVDDEVHAALGFGSFGTTKK